MKTKSVLGIVGLFIAQLILVGCITYEEELWLNQDGSGRLRFEVSIAEAMMALAERQPGTTPFSIDTLRQNLSKVEGVSVQQVKSFSKGGNRVFSAEISFKSLDAIRQASAAPSAPNIFGTIELSENKEGNIVVSRIIDMRSNRQGVSRRDDPFATAMEGMAAAMLAGYSWKYKVHFPSKVLTANTADEYIDRATNTVTWEFALASLINSSVTMSATVAKPLPPFLSILASLVFPAVVAILFLGTLLAGFVVVRRMGR